MNKSIRKGITTFKIVIWGGKLSVLHSEVTFYCHKNKICDHKTPNLPPQITILVTIIP